MEGFETIMSVQFDKLAASVSADGCIAPEELHSLRQLGWGDGKIHRGEAEAIFAINNSLTQRDVQWVDFFVEAIGDFVLNGTEPRGTCSDEEARWLVDMIDHDGRVESMAELELLVRTIERASNLPDFLKDYTLRQIEDAVLTGTGPTRGNGQLSDTHISATECTILRRVVFASGGHGPAAVSRFDAELLFRLKDATDNGANADEWTNLFVDGVANYLKGFMLENAQQSHERLVELEAFIADNEPNMGRFMRQMVKEVPQVQNQFGRVFGKKASAETYAEMAAVGKAVTLEEQAWLETMIKADGEIDALERALLDRIAAEA